MSETTLKISEMTPDSNLTGAEIFPFVRGGVEDNFTTTLDNIKEYFNIPTKVSQLENDSKYITQANVPTNVGDFENNVGYITRDNTTVFTPIGDYNPSTKKYVDDLMKVKFIDSGSMDDVTQVGGYVISPSVSGNPCSPYYCWLRVVGIADVVQEAISYSDLSVKRRSRRNNNWDPWKSFDSFGKTIDLSDISYLLTNVDLSDTAASNLIINVFGNESNFRNVVDNIIDNHTKYWFNVVGPDSNLIEVGSVNTYRSFYRGTYEMHFIITYYSGNKQQTKRISFVQSGNTYVAKITDLIISDNLTTITKKTSAEYASSSKDANTAYFVTD